MPTFRIGEIGINYWTVKVDSAQKKGTVLFIHGAGGSQLSWSFQKAFFEKEFYPIMIDLPGHGDSGGEGEDKIERYTDDVYSFLQALELRRIFLIGHSMGGAIIQTLALSHPELIRGVVLAGTGARLKVLPWVLEAIRNDFEQTVKNIVRYAYSPRAPQELIDRGIEHLMNCRPRVLYGDFLACDRFDLMKEVEKIELPALILCGSDDQMTPLKYSEFLHQRIKNSKLDVIKGAGHMLMMESPELFNQKIREFILGIVS